MVLARFVKFLRKFHFFLYNGKTYSIKSSTSCGSSYVVYLIRCPCGLIYVGKTIRPFRVHMGEHRSRLCCGRTETPIVQHGLDRGHVFSDLRCFCIDQNRFDFGCSDAAKLLGHREQ